MGRIVIYFIRKILKYKTQRETCSRYILKIINQRVFLTPDYNFWIKNKKAALGSVDSTAGMIPAWP